MWGRKRGIDDLLAKVRSNELETLALLPSRTFGPAEAVRLARALKSSRKLKELYASSHSIGVEGAAAIGEAMALNTSLNILCIGGSDMGDDGVVALVSSGLEVNITLKRLDLDFKSLESCDHVSALLEKHPALQDLRIGRNQLEDAAICKLCTGLSKSGSLTSLDLSDNSIAENGAAVLGASMPVQLTSLDVSQNSIGETGGIRLFQALSPCSGAGLTCISLRSCNLGSNSVSALSIAIRSGYAPLLLKLDVSHNTEVSDTGAAALAEIPRLQWLNVSHTGMGVAGALALGSSARSLTYLDISGNLVTAAGVVPLLSLTALTELSAFNNKLSDEGAHSLAIAVSSQPEAQSIAINLSRLDLGGNGITGVGISLLLPSLSRKFTALRVLEIGGNTIDDAVEEAVRMMKVEMPHLDVVYRANGQSENPNPTVQ